VVLIGGTTFLWALKTNWSNYRSFEEYLSFLIYCGSFSLFLAVWSLFTAAVSWWLGGYYQHYHEQGLLGWLISSPFLSGIGAYLFYLAFGTTTSTSLGVFSVDMLLGLISTIHGIQAYQANMGVKRRRRKELADSATDNENETEQNVNSSPKSRIDIRRRTEIPVPESTEIID